MLSSVASSVLYHADIIESGSENITSKGMVIFYAALVIIFLLGAGKALYGGYKDGSWKGAIIKAATLFVALMLIGGAAMWVYNSGGEGVSRQGNSVVKDITQ